MQGFFGDVGLGARPGLGLVQKRTNLGEQLGRKGVLALERLDALQPGEDAPRFLHLSTVAASSRRVCDASDTKASTRERSGGEVAGRTCPQAEQGFVQRGQEPRTVFVLEHFDDRPADVVRDLNAARLASRERAEAVDQPGALGVAVREQQRRPHRGRPEAVGAAEERGERFAQVLGARRLVLEERELPPRQGIRQLEVVLEASEPREQLGGEAAAPRIEPAGVTCRAR